MRKLVNTCNTIFVLLVLFAVVGCLPAKRTGEERPTGVSDSPESAERFQPLDLPQDLEVVPEKYPQTGKSIGTSAEFRTPSEADSTSEVLPRPVQEELDALHNQVYRIQLFTTKLYGSAQQELSIAEEIFDQPVYLDYEVPYFKIRVGNFTDREQAEDYLQRVKAAGYPKAWVVMVTVGVKEVAPLYPEDEIPVLPDSLESMKVLDEPHD